MILVFDLDDTLFDELSYVRSGLQAVAKFVAAKTGTDSGRLNRHLEDALKTGRGEIFDRAFRACGIYSKGLVRASVSVYRKHEPEITLFPEADRCLNRFRDHPLYIVSDGNTTAQSRKIRALGLDGRVRFCFLTWRHGRRHAKPSPHCFLKICQRENSVPSRVVYIADNPGKDFVGLKPLGFHTVRVLTGQHRDLKMPPEYQAAAEIPNLDGLTRDFFSN